MIPEEIAALELAASALDWHTHSDVRMKAAASIRAHIADLKAGGERAKVVAYVRDFASKVDCRGCPNMEPNVSINLLADAIASGAHMENNNVD